MTTTASPTSQKITLQPQHTTEIQVASGQNIIVDHTVQGATMQNGALVIRFDNGATLVIKNYGEVAAAGAQPTLTMADGHSIQLASLVEGSAQPSAQQAQAAGDFVPTLGDGKAVLPADKTAKADHTETIAMPQPGQHEVVTLVDGTAYKFAFNMTDPTSVATQGQSLVITFKNGGEIVIPNYGSFHNDASAPQITMKDGTALSASNMGDVLAAASQLQDVEPAAGGAGGAGGHGFGFQSAFAASPFQGVNAIGPINPTQLQYGVEDRRPLPVLEQTNTPGTPNPPVPNLTVGNSQTPEDTPTGPLHIDSHPNTPTEQITITITGIPAGWTVDTSTSGGTYDTGTGTWTYTAPVGKPITQGPSLNPPADSDVDIPHLGVDVSVTDTSTGLTSTTHGDISVIVDAVIDGPALNLQNATGAEDHSIPLNVSINHGGDNTDGSERITNITITLDVPGATLSAGTHNADGSWTLTEAQLAGLTVTPPHNYNGDINVHVSATEYDKPTDIDFDNTNNTATVTGDFVVHVTPEDDTPVLKVDNVQVLEDHSVQLPIHAELAPGSTSADNLVITITGIQPGWTVDTTNSGGVYNSATGTWTVNVPNGQAYNGGPVFTPPADSDVDMNNLHVTVQQYGPNDQLIGTNEGTVNIIVDAVIDGPALNLQNATGAEDHSIPLNVSINHGGDNTDGSERITNITITLDVPGATLSAGTHNADGSWTLTEAQLAGLTVTPPHNYNGDINVHVSATEYDKPTDIDFDNTNNTATVTGDFVVHVTPEDDTPVLKVENAQVLEDHSVQLPIHAELAPGSTTADHLVVTITGIQPGWTVDTTNSGGVYNSATGTWTVNVPNGQAYNGGPVFTPPADSDVDMNNLHVTVQQYGPNDQLIGTNEGTVNIIVDAVIDAPTVTASGSGSEDHPIPLTININPQGDHTDGSERITDITVKIGMPGVTLSAGTYDAANGVWHLTEAQLAGLTMTAPANYSGNIPVHVSVTEYDKPTDIDFDNTNNTATVTTDINVHVSPVADAPNVSAVDKVVKEDGSVALQINASLKDTDGSETLTVKISGIQPGWTVDTHLSGGTYDAATGTWTLSLPAGVTSFSGGPTISPPHDSDADLNNLTVTATATESDGSTASSDAHFNVITDAVIDAPTLTVGNTSGEEDHAIALNIAAGHGGDSTDGSEVLSAITISGVPAGATLSAGTNLGGGVWQVSESQLAGLTITPAHGYTGNINLTVSVTDTETNLSGLETDYSDNSATVTKTLTVTVGPDDVPQIIDPAERSVDETNLSGGTQTVTGTIQANFYSDGPGTFSATGASSFSFGGSATNGQLTSGGVPVTVTMSGNTYVGKAGGVEVFHLTVNADGSYSFQLLKPLDHANTNDPNDSLTLNFGIKATDTDGDSDTTTLTVRVYDDGVTAHDDHNTVNINASGNGAADGNVITGLHGGPGAADSVSQDGHNTVTQVSFGGHTVSVPDGGSATIQGNYGTLTIYSDGHYTYTLDPSKTTTTTTVPVTTTSGSSSSTSSDTSSSSTSTDGNTTTSTSSSSSSSTSTSSTTTTTTTVTTVVPSVHDEFTYTLTDRDGDHSNAALTFDGAGANRPTLAVHDEQVKEDGSVQLHIQANLTNPAEHLTVTVTGIPAAWIDTAASGGTYNAATGTWTTTLAPGQNFSGGPVLHPPHDSDADLTGLSVTAYSTNASGASSVATGTINVITDAVIDAPTLNVTNATGNEDTPIALNISAGHGGDSTDGSEVLSKITISGVPAGATLSAGTHNSDGTWSLTEAQLQGLTLTPPANYSGTLHLTVSVTDTETNLSGQEYDYSDNSATATSDLTVTVNPVADVPNVSAVDKVVKEDGSVALQVNASLNDTDGSERLTVTITGIEAGWSVNTAASGGTYNAATGTWTLTLPAGVTSFSGGPTISPPHDSDADLNGLRVTATATESNGTTASAHADFHVITDAVIDGPTLNVANASGEEGHAIALNIAAGHGGDTTDGSEVLSAITISGVPAGASLSAGTNLGGGVWSLTEAQLAGLTITAPTHGNYTLTVSVTDTETNLSGLETDYTDNSATVTRQLTLNVGTDDVPTIVAPAVQQVDETNLASGHPTVSGAVSADFHSDGPGTFSATGANSFSFEGSALGGHLTSNGVAVLVSMSGNTYIGKANGAEVFRLTLNANGTYNFVLSGPLDHANAADPNDAITLNFGVTATDNDGDSASTGIQIKVLDDVPVAHNDVQSLAMSDTGAGSATGNVITGLNGGAGAADTLSQDHGNVIGSVSFGGHSVNIPATGTASIEGLYGTLTIAADGSYTYTLKPAAASAATSQTTDTFTYNLHDTDGDNSTATLTLHALGSTIKVGTNTDDHGGSTTPYVVGDGTGDITGRGGNDILIGDKGGSSSVKGKDYNFVLVLDVSGSMGHADDPASKYALLVKAVENLVNELHNYQDGNVRVHIVPFADAPFAMGTFDVTSAAGLQQAMNYLEGMNVNGGYTNYEAALQAAIAWLQGNNQSYGHPIAGAETYTYFVSDGVPNMYVAGEGPNGGGHVVYAGDNAPITMNQILGSDGTNEVQMIQSLSHEVISVGINIGSGITNLNTIDSDGHAINVTDPTQLTAVLSNTNPVNQLNAVGHDHIVGGDGNDLIFGDSINTDALAAAHGLATPAGAGWSVFTQLESNASYHWSRTDTINYINSHATELAQETTVGGSGRTGGNDTLEGGLGDDIIFGQEGNDLIIGGAGNDTLTGGSGADTFKFTSANDGIDHITDFNAAQGDVLDISSILTGVDPTSAAIHNFVQIVHQGADSILQVDTTGTGAHFQTIAVLQGVNVDVDHLMTSGNLIA